MKEEIFTVTGNKRIADGVYEMVLEGNTDEVKMPGQFVNIRLDGFFLRRPISICENIPSDNGEGRLKLIYKVVGHGTDAMTALRPGDTLDMLTGLGHGFDVNAAGAHPLLVGGGVGTPPMYGLAKALVLAGKPVDVILGFNAAKDVFYTEEFDALNELYEFGCEGFDGPRPKLRVHVATVSGEVGTKGFVTDVLPDIASCSHYYACGPVPMLKALKAAMSERFPGVFGELSLEERMGCGFGACVGCSIDTASGYRKVCTDGPVFLSTEVFTD